MTDILVQLREACIGHPHAKIEWPHRLLHDAITEIERLRQALQLHAGDCMSLSNELDQWRDRALVAEIELAAEREAAQ